MLVSKSAWIIIKYFNALTQMCNKVYIKFHKIFRVLKIYCKEDIMFLKIFRTFCSLCNLFIFIIQICFLWQLNVRPKKVLYIKHHYLYIVCSSGNCWRCLMLNEGKVFKYTHGFYRFGQKNYRIGVFYDSLKLLAMFAVIW